ncbi:MAG: iron-sulfur cluster assembly accessory protein [Thermodesulfovibrionales bacterium]|nr:iron-sulfur cluster assembly accessory protein [Thermodesulfovibrionales bacterium]
MFTITDRAIDKAKEILVVEGKSDWGLRIFCAGESCCGPSFGLDINEEPAIGDQVFEKNGLKVFLEQVAFEKLFGMQLDYYDDGQRAGFILTGGAPSCSSSDCSSCS